MGRNQSNQTVVKESSLSFQLFVWVFGMHLAISGYIAVIMFDMNAEVHYLSRQAQRIDKMQLDMVSLDKRVYRLESHD